MKKIYILIAIIVVFLLGKEITKSINNRKVLKEFKRIIPNDNFYFIRGLDRERSFATNIRYRGIVYSDKLKEAKSKMGIEIALESLSSLWMYESDYKRMYENALAYPKAEKYVRENAKKIFGENQTLAAKSPI